MLREPRPLLLKWIPALLSEPKLSCLFRINPEGASFVQYILHQSHIKYVLRIAQAFNWDWTEIEESRETVIQYVVLSPKKERKIIWYNYNSSISDQILNKILIS